MLKERPELVKSVLENDLLLISPYIDRLRSLNSLIIERNIKTSKDIDGVEVNSADLSVRFYNSATGENRKLCDVTKYFIMQQWLESSCLNGKIESAERFWNSFVVANYSHPEPGALALSKNEHDAGVNVPRITSRPAKSRNWTFKWYARWMPWVDAGNILVQDEVGIPVGVDFKVSQIKEHQINVHYEDYFEQAEKIVDASDCFVVLVPQQWNLGYQPMSDRIITVDGFEDAPALVRAHLTSEKMIRTGNIL